MIWASTRSSALDRVRAFASKTGHTYTSKRNFDFGPDDRSNVSVLSPWIRHRLILEEEVLRTTLKHHSFSVAEKFIQEVFWRTYCKGWLELHPRVWSRYRSELVHLLSHLDGNEPLRKRYGKAIEGKTGIDCFDAWVKELVDIGYLHNHARMWFASIWIFTLRLPWQLGADFFYRHLLDGDPASNTVSWRWVAGLHTKGKTYLARPANIARYTNGRFNPEGQLAAHAPEVVEQNVEGTVPLPLADSMPEDKPYGLLITEEDGSPETLNLFGCPVAAIGLTATDLRSPLPIGSAAWTFANGAVADTLDRATQRFNIDTIQPDGESWGPILTDWAGHLKLNMIVTAYPPVGPVAERLAAAKPNLEKAGVRLVKIRRPYDAVAWPHATKGFFKLKARLPMILSELNIST